LCAPLRVCAHFVDWDAHRPLTWADFEGKFDKANPFDSYTLANISYTYHWQKGDRLLSYQFTIKNRLLKDSSWVRKNKETPALLKHEQLHFDIAELYARKLLLAFNAKIYTANYDQEIKDIYARVLKEVREMQARYDAETDHFKNKAEQARWESYIADQLQQTPPYH
jgi:hypothetical protein